MIFLSYELSQIKKKDSGRSDRGAMTKQQPVKEHYKAPGFATALLALVISIAILILNPISDIFYYAGVILTLAGVFITIKDLIFYYNIMATRRLPQFDRTGGDDRA